jgi:hypothetical protein
MRHGAVVSSISAEDQKNFLVFSLFQDSGIDALAKRYSPHPIPLLLRGSYKSPRVMCLGELAKLSAEQR